MGNLEAFHAALTAQAARSELKNLLKIEIVRDLFISKMKKHDFAGYLNFQNT